MLLTSVCCASAPAMPLARRQVGQRLDASEGDGRPAASCRAHDIDTVGNSDSAVTRLMTPQRSSATGSWRRPNIAISFARARPARCTTRCTPPSSGSRPSEDFGHAEERGIGGHDHVAGQRQFEAAAERAAVHGGDGRKRYVLKRVEQRFEPGLIAPPPAARRSRRRRHPRKNDASRCAAESTGNLARPPGCTRSAYP